MSRLEKRDYYILIDKSGSMSNNDTPTKQTRFEFAEESTVAIARAVEPFDPDGITLIPFAGSFKRYDFVTPSRVADVFKENQPMGGTMLSRPLKEVFEDFLKNKRADATKENGAICIVITDGEPQDQDEVAKTIVDFTKQLDNGDDEFGLLFVQVGNDPAAKKYLTMLDDNLDGAKFDIVDVKTFEEIEEIGVLAALEASLDD